jgi:hypothetical protein
VGMRARVLILALLAISACAGSQPWLKRDLTYRDLEEHRTELVGQNVTVYAAVEQRFTGGSPSILWLSAAARAHAFGASRANFCIWADDKTGRLGALEPWTIVRVRGVVRIDESIVPKVMECPSQLTMVTSSVEVLPAPKR